MPIRRVERAFGLAGHTRPEAFSIYALFLRGVPLFFALSRGAPLSHRERLAPTSSMGIGLASSRAFIFRP
jgi:hypothetical protein